MTERPPDVPAPAPGPAADPGVPGDLGAPGDRGERPLADCLADFWQGDFTLGDTAGSAAVGSSGSSGTALRDLGPSGITVGGRDLADLLAPAYRRFTDD
ncbi:hypothetical protein [Kitasatospora sp. NPDC094015]|uniref:hypothetical protein n=1 Tax=Kitasatospora sp. NPDC094015 TaxID=3155205 RepID=UPI00332BA061